MDKIDIGKYSLIFNGYNRYFKWYASLCESRLCMHRFKGDGNYYERHHIIPKWLGGSNHPSNLVLFTAREHYLAHYFLFLYLRDKQSAAAFHIMNETVNNVYRDSKKYEEVRKFQSINLRGDKNPAKCEIARKKISNKVSGLNNGMYGMTGSLNPFFGKTHTQEFMEMKKHLHGHKITYNGIEYPSIRDAERQTGVSRFKIKKAAGII